MIQLESVAFNHDSNAATHDAISLRRNVNTWLTVPEWQRGVNVLPEDSTAAYAVAQVAGNTVTIQASLSCSDPTIRTARVRTRDAVIDPPRPSGCLGWLITLIRGILRMLFGNVLGEVKARTVTFTGGQTGSLSFDLKHTKLQYTGVGPHTTRWRWQYKVKKGPWVDFQLTEHRIFVLLDLPTAPWQQTPYQQNNTQLPWADVLKYACQWGLGATTQVAAARGVTRGVYQLGPAVVKYDCPGGGTSHYIWGLDFECTRFIERLQGGFGNGHYVNCSDCATFVSTFANILGCDLWQSRMSGSMSFGLNPMLGIGSSTWEPCCHGEPGWSDAFAYHEVAWTGACTVTERVYDGCLQVDGDADPTVAPHTALLPVEIVFGNPGDLTYRDRLATPAGRLQCNPQPSTRQRRPVS
jgi:hypothetical protein